MLKVSRSECQWFAGAMVAIVLAVPATARAQVVVIANGSPITEYDIQQRMKLEASSTQKTATRQQIINDLIDDRLKISRAKVYGLEVTDAEVNNAFEGMATRQHITSAQFAQVLERAGISPNTVKARIRAELTWQQLIRGKYGSSLQIGESDIANALKDRNENEAAAVGYVYTLYPVTDRGSARLERGYDFSQAQRRGKSARPVRLLQRRSGHGTRLARCGGARSDYAKLGRLDAHSCAKLLGNIQVGHLTAPEVTAQGLQMFAVCNKKETHEPNLRCKREVREQLFAKRFESEVEKISRRNSQVGDDRIQEPEMSEPAGLPLALTLGEPAGIGPELTIQDLATP